MGNTKIENVKGLNRAELAMQFRRFVEQKPGFDLSNYGDQASFKQDYRGYKKDADFNRSLPLGAIIETFSDLTDEELAHRVFDQRLYIDENQQIDYIEGQYFCTEYQWAARDTFEKAKRIAQLKSEGKW
jgi:hypothetical protein